MLSFSRFTSLDVFFSLTIEIVADLTFPLPLPYLMILFLRDCLYFFFLMQFSRCAFAAPLSGFAAGGLKWTRTTDLALIRRAL